VNITVTLYTRSSGSTTPLNDSSSAISWSCQEQRAGTGEREHVTTVPAQYSMIQYSAVQYNHKGESALTHSSRPSSCTRGCTMGMPVVSPPRLLHSPTCPVQCSTVLYDTVQDSTITKVGGALTHSSRPSSCARGRW